MPNLQDVRRAHIKPRNLIETYILQETKPNFKIQQADLYRLESEDFTHFLLSCPAIGTVREIHNKTLRDLVIEK